MKSDIERTLEVQSQGYFENKEIREKICELGKLYYSCGFQNYLKENSKKNSEDYALVGTVDYISKIKNIKCRNGNNEEGLETLLDFLINSFN